MQQDATNSEKELSERQVLAIPHPVIPVKERHPNTPIWGLE